MQTAFYLAVTTEYPPALPIPRRYEEAEHEDDRTGIKQSLAADGDRTFSTFCSFWTIVSEVLFIYRNTEAPQANSLAFAESKFYKLLSWAENLHVSMVRGEHNPAHVVVLQ